MMFIAVLLDNVIYRPIYIEEFHSRPAVFWMWLVAYNVAFLGAMLGLLVFRSRRANIALLAIAILLLTIPYWSFNFADVIVRQFGYR